MTSDDAQTPTTDVHVLLSPGHATPSAAARALVDKHGASLRRQFVGVDDESLDRHWVATTKAGTAGDLAGELSQLPDVEGAYVPPPVFPA